MVSGMKRLGGDGLLFLLSVFILILVVLVSAVANTGENDSVAQQPALRTEFFFIYRLRPMGLNVSGYQSCPRSLKIFSSLPASRVPGTNFYRGVINTVIMRASAPGFDRFLNHAVLAFFSLPGAITPLGAITPIPVRKHNQIISFCLFPHPRCDNPDGSILSSSASTIVTDGLLLQSVGCRAGCVLCTWWSASIVPITVKKTT